MTAYFVHCPAIHNPLRLLRPLAPGSQVVSEKTFAFRGSQQHAEVVIRAPEKGAAELAQESARLYEVRGWIFNQASGPNYYWRGADGLWALTIKAQDDGRTVRLDHEGFNDSDCD